MNGTRKIPSSTPVNRLVFTAVYGIKGFGGEARWVVFPGFGRFVCAVLAAPPLALPAGDASLPVSTLGSSCRCRKPLECTDTACVSPLVGAGEGPGFVECCGFSFAARTGGGMTITEGALVLVMSLSLTPRVVYQAACFAFIGSRGVPKFSFVSLSDRCSFSLGFVGSW